ncbi:MAG TPA: GIY-YIG nuclease family protein [Kiloniellales bacterium]|nr:GIY-YIG nuclease family protein [Kiloniellales bacterium]
MPYYVYIMTNQRNGTLYIGVTNDLMRRAHEHRIGAVPGFTRRYDLKRLVYFEAHDSAAAASQREKTMKHWRRDWKVALIERANPDWCDLFEDLAR